MLFFIPVSLVKLEYLGKESDDIVIDEESKKYEKERTLAFFVANFGYTKTEFEKLTKTEILLIMRAWEEKQVLESQLMANAFYNAYSNAHLKKGKKAIPLWNKIKKKNNVALLKKQYEELLEYEKCQPNDWIFKLYEGR